MRYIPFDEMVESAMTVVKDKNSIARAVIKQWIWMGVKKLKFNEHHIKTSDAIAVENLAIKKPDDYVRPKELTLWDVNNKQFKYIWKGKGQIIKEQLSTNSWIYVSENPDFFLLNSNGENVEYGLLTYYSWPIDKTGYPLVPEDAEEPLVQFVAWMYSKREKDPASTVDMNRRDWIKSRSEYNANSKMPHPIAGREIARTFGSLIQKQVRTSHGPRISDNTLFR